ncbi:DciA family protein [Porphyromonas sp.]
MRRSETLSLQAALAQLWDEDPELYEHMLERQLLDQLPTLLGVLGRYLQKASIDDGVLRLKMTSAAARQELNMRLNPLREQLNRAVRAELVRIIQVF